MSLYDRVLSEDKTIRFPVPGRGPVAVTRPDKMSGGPRVLDLSVEALWAVRQRGNPIDSDNVDDLVEKMGRQGQREPIELAWWGRRPEIVEGHHRLYAADEMGWKTLKAKVDPSITDATLRALGLVDS